MQHIQQHDENCKIYRMVFDYTQLLSRVAFPILQNPHLSLPHITDPLITMICQFLAESRLNIVIPQLYIPQPPCINNSNIISEIMKIKNAIVIQVNQCRIVLQVT
jgi:hypothetical protein